MASVSFENSSEILPVEPSSDTSFLKNVLLRILLTGPLRFKGLITLPFLTRLFVTRELYGVWGQIIVVKIVLSGLVTLRLETAVVRYLSGEPDAKRIIRGVLGVTALCSIALMLILLSFGESISRVVFRFEKYHTLFLPVAVWIFVSASMQVGLAVLRSREKIVSLSIREALSAVWMVVSVTIAYWLQLDMVTLIVLCILGDVALLAWVLAQIGFALPKVFSYKSFYLNRKYIVYSLPLVAGFLLLWITNSIDRFVIVHMLGLDNVATYGVMSQYCTLLTAVLNPINFVLFPKVAACWEAKDKSGVQRYFSQAFALSFLLGAPCIVGLWAISDGVIPLLAGREYLASPLVILFILLSLLLARIYVGNQYVFHLLNKTYLLPFIYGATAAMSFGLCYVFTLRWGLVGAGLSRFVTFLAAASILSIVVRRKIPSTIPFAVCLKAAGAALAMGGVVYWLPKTTWPQLLICIAAGASVYFGLLFLLGVLKLSMLLHLKDSALSSFGRIQAKPIE